MGSDVTIGTIGETMTSTIRRPGVRAARAGFLAAPFVGLAVAVALVWQSSYAAFTDDTSNGVNEWRAGTVTLDDNDSGAAMFDLTRDGAIRPGSTGERCIEVQKDGDLAGAVKLYGSGLTTTKGLATALNLTIEQGSGTAADCTNFVEAGADVYSGTLAGFTFDSFATGRGDWAPAAGLQKRTYRFSYSLPPTADNTVQGGTAAITFLWEVQNT